MLAKLDHILGKCSDLINVVSKYVLGIIVATMFASIILQVALRYLFNTGLSWPEELTTFLMAWMTFLGSAIAVKQMEHISINMFVERLPQRGQLLMRLITKITMLLFVILLVYLGYNLAVNSVNYFSNALRLSLFWPRLSILVGGSIMVLHLVHFIVRDLREVRRT
ncbi:Tripartite ATP-independent periplasmic transporter DctQ component [Caldalkalibacillus thermarum TA2.A1]|uniref:TRAP transporter small permease n=1 Tax=Caldalkalibacillus thermarum (strain TA2.A1) TaxID=986075 RepID=F5L748_CALTT|nr:TRAP transporter small permease [Caldalkalibacillus thermarum]EGL82824.1 Tripartite ATP-independent periplasmic transporter DctQ component [Caldalkalibacillus thermarum TA2.A1]QZT34872.1 TRAP transporter small permease [Caldalkalibacillus thermarum TA2.A1]